MPLELPNLDDRTYADLVEEARRLIPSFDPAWTNHNPSDPGITLVETFAYLTEMLLYRLNRVTEANQRRFIKLLQGSSPVPAPTGDLTADTRQVVQWVRARWRAVSAADYERLSAEDFNEWLLAMQAAEAAGNTAALGEWWVKTGLEQVSPETGQPIAEHRPSQVPAVARARCLPERNLDLGSETERTRLSPAHVSVIAVPEVSPLDPPQPLLRALWGFLDERRILTTRHHVLGAWHAPVGADLVIARTHDAVEQNVADRVIEKLTAFLDPLDGGPSGEGWPFGRDVYVSELVEQLEGVPGVDYVTDVMLSSACGPDETSCAPASLLWHAEGDLIGLSLEGHHLPEAGIDPARIVIRPHASFVPVKVTVTVTAGTADPASLRQQVKSAVRSFFHPLTADPVEGPEDTQLFYRDDLEDALTGIPTSSPPVLEVDPGRVVSEGGTGFWIDADELVNWQTVVVINP